LQPASLSDQLAEAKEQLSSTLQQLGKKHYTLITCRLRSVAYRAVSGLHLDS